jgi:hypothetical protein
MQMIFPVSDLFLMDIPTCAKLMSTTTFAVRELMRAGELIYVPIGHKWLVSPDAIQRTVSSVHARRTGRDGELVYKWRTSAKHAAF